MDGVSRQGVKVFTGIIQSIGRIAAIEGDQQDIRLRIETGKLPLENVALGDSIATSGVFNVSDGSKLTRAPTAF